MHDRSMRDSPNPCFKLPLELFPSVRRQLFEFGLRLENRTGETDKTGVEGVAGSVSAVSEKS
jgi:hypothetical protein